MGTFWDQLEGGLADKRQPDNYDQDQISKGIKVEMEHTDDPDLAREIVMDHLEEIPDYYDHLKEMEDRADKEGSYSFITNISGYSGEEMHKEANIDSIVNKLEKLTDGNHHTEAYILIAEQILRNKRLANAFKGIEMLSEYYRGLPQKVSDVRYSLYQEMKKYLESKLSPEDFKKVYMAT